MFGKGGQLVDDRGRAAPEAILVHTIKRPGHRKLGVPADEEGAPAGHLCAACVLSSVDGEAAL